MGQTPKRTLGDVVRAKAPTSTRDDVLLEIEGQEVEIASVEIDMDHQGRWRKYPLTQVTLTDGRTFSVAGKSVAEPLSYLEPGDFPVGARFSRKPSDFDPTSSYWTVE